MIASYTNISQLISLLSAALPPGSLFWQPAIHLWGCSFPCFEQDSSSSTNLIWRWKDPVLLPQFYELDRTHFSINARLCILNTVTWCDWHWVLPWPVLLDLRSERPAAFSRALSSAKQEPQPLRNWPFSPQVMSDNPEVQPATAQMDPSRASLNQPSLSLKPHRDILAFSLPSALSFLQKEHQLNKPHNRLYSDVENPSQMILCNISTSTFQTSSLQLVELTQKLSS